MPPTSTHTSRAGDGHPTRTVDVTVTCVLINADPHDLSRAPRYEITVEAERYQSWRFVVADAAPYPVGSTITLEVPA
jgi:hypothetical protein